MTKKHEKQFKKTFKTGGRTQRSIKIDKSTIEILKEIKDKTGMSYPKQIATAVTRSKGTLLKTTKPPVQDIEMCYVTLELSRSKETDPVGEWQRPELCMIIGQLINTWLISSGAQDTISVDADLFYIPEYLFPQVHYDLGVSTSDRARILKSLQGKKLSLKGLTVTVGPITTYKDTRIIAGYKSLIDWKVEI